MNWEFVTLMLTIIGSVGACYKFMHDDMDKMENNWRELRKEDKELRKEDQERWQWLFNWAHQEIEHIKSKNDPV